MGWTREGEERIRVKRGRVARTEWGDHKKRENERKEERQARDVVRGVLSKRELKRKGEKRQLNGKK